MHRNYFLFAEQVRWLNTKVSGAKIESCFSHRKSELVIQLNSDTNNFLRLGLQPYQPYVLLSTARNIKDAKISFFQDIVGEKIQNLKILPFDKLVHINLQNYFLKIYFYGSQPNVILFDKSENEIDYFKKSKRKLTNHKNDIFLNPFECSNENISNLITGNKNLSLEKFLSHYVGGFNLLLARECCFRAGLDSNMTADELNSSDLHDLLKCIRQISSEAENPKPKIYFKNDLAKHLTIFPFQHLVKDHQAKEYENINEAWKEFLRLRFNQEKLGSMLAKISNTLDKAIQSTKKTLDKITEFEKLEKRKKLAELKGNLLLTNIPDIPSGANTVELKNIFSEQQEFIKIKLNPAKSVQENAQKYFEKFKDIETQAKQLENKKYMLMQELTDLQLLVKKCPNINSIKDAEKIYNILIQKRLIQSDQQVGRNEINLEYSFKKTILDQKWQIYIGKNAKNNDLLTFKFAHKFDLWFHVQGAAGSHVVIRLSSKNELPPAKIIEQTASIAAFHSDMKHSSTVPVIYTQVRYVRKPRKAKPGTASVLQHKTIFVEPKGI